MFPVLSARLNEQKTQVDELKDETESKVYDVVEQLRAQQTTVDTQTDDIDTLKEETAGTCTSYYPKGLFKFLFLMESNPSINAL